MTLKEKFLPFVDDIDLINDIPNEEWGLRNANKCVEIADDLAIGFAEWITINYPNQKQLLLKQGNLMGFYTTKELLEIYKKEKGL